MTNLFLAAILRIVRESIAQGDYLDSEKSQKEPRDFKAYACGFTAIGKSQYRSKLIDSAYSIYLLSS